ncbi:MAG: hypothetical protein PHD82_17570 [Candidatus Riflebacteria bacterium]|nr:hypothetical protein [Candidatus Riflebacteria bacterium]
MNFNKNRLLTGIFTAGLALSSFVAQAAEEKDIADLEKQLIQAESKLLEPELRLDKLQQDRSKYDGASGWFQGSKKKALDSEIEKNKTLVDQQYAAMRSTAEQVQKMVFAVAQTFEKHGQYAKAIEYYLKVENRNDSVRERIASCYKAAADYQQAIKWLLEMQRNDTVLLEVVDCCKLDNSMKEAVYWLFEILKPWSENSAELAALDLIEKYDYPQRQHDYPDFFRRLSDVYIAKSVAAYQSNFLQATRDYRKAVELLATDMNETPSLVSFAILDRHQNDYRAALEILDRQKEAAERNFEDKVRRARQEIDDAEDNLRRARMDADRDYESRLRNAEHTARRASDKLNEVKGNTAATPEELKRAQQMLDNANRDLEHIRRNRDEIIREYMRPYHREVEEARDAYDRLLANRTRFIEEYIAPYKRQVAEAKKSFDLIKTLHDANFK